MASMWKEGDGNKHRATSAGWMLTFADLLALLLTFFVLLFSMNSVQSQRWEELINVFAEELNPKRPRVEIDNSKPIETVKNRVERGLSLEYLEGIIRARAENSRILRDVMIGRKFDRLYISFMGDEVFVADTIATMKPEVRNALDEIGGALAQIDNQIVIAGHADSRSPLDERFVSRWEVSLERANEFADILSASGYRKPISIAGYGESGFNLLDDSIPLQDRYEMLNRVDIIILDEIRNDGDDAIY